MSGLAMKLLVVAILAAAWWVITRSTMVTACTLATGSMLVIQRRHAPGVPFDSLVLGSVVLAVANLYLERIR